MGLEMGFHGYFQLLIEIIVGFFALLGLTKIMGRSSIAESTPFDFVSVLVISEFFGNAIYDDKVDLAEMVFSIVSWGVLVIFIDFLTLKINKTRGVFESKPSILINNGIINRSELKRNKIDINRLQSLLREKNTFSFREVDHAVLEPNGKLSVIKKSNFDSLRRMDMNLPAISSSLPITLISDGVIIKRNLELLQKDSQWLTDELAVRGIHNVREVMVAEWRLEDGIYVQTIIPEVNKGKHESSTS